LYTSAIVHLDQGFSSFKSYPGTARHSRYYRANTVISEEEFMVRFTSAPVEEVAPKRKQRQPSQRAQIQREYQEALRDAVLDRQEALIVELDADDKALTIRNRIRRAATVIGLEDIVIRRRGQRVVAYASAPEDN
jgi:hypothetical protein